MTDKDRIAEQPIDQEELERAKQRALEKMREKGGSFAVDPVFTGVEAAWEWFTELFEAYAEVARGETETATAEATELREQLERIIHEHGMTEVEVVDGLAGYRFQHVARAALAPHPQGAER